MNFKVVINVIGAITVLLSGFMLLPLAWSIVMKESIAHGLFYSFVSTFLFGAGLFYFTKSSNKDIHKEEGYLIVTLSWLAISCLSSLPYLFSELDFCVVDSLFESVSGLTTTGASIINDIEGLPQGLLLWRSLTQWLGGMGVIVLTIAILPLLGVGGVELFVAESPGPTSTKLHPRIKETAKRLWFIYVGLTLVLIMILKLEGMNIFDSINHGLTTMATGGFSTKNASMAFFSPLIQYTVALFMLMAGINYAIIYFCLKGKFKKAWSSEEFRTYLFVVIAISLVFTLTIYLSGNTPLEQSFRNGTFQVISLITTTGFVTADYTSWHPALTLMSFSLLFIGACAGSTSGGIKIIRHLVYAKHSWLEFKRIMYPNSLIRARLDNSVISARVMNHVLVFLLVYIITYFAFTLLVVCFLTHTDTPLLTSLGAVATALGNVGPGIGDLGPLDNFNGLPSIVKLILSFAMIVGRLELFSVLILFTPFFWRRTNNFSKHS